MLWLRSAREYRRAAPRTAQRAAKPGPAAAAEADPASSAASSALAALTAVLISTLTDVAGALVLSDAPRTHPPSGAARDGPSADGEAEERLQQFLAEDR